jgi:hypothetical protein
MRPISPRLAGPPCSPAASPGAGAARTPDPGRRGIAPLGGLWLAVWLAACHGAPAPVAPGEPIAAPAEVALGTMEVECEALIAAFGVYKQCPNLEDEDREVIDAWRERAEQDFAAGKKANPEPNAQRAIAAACHKAAASVTAAGERCRAGPRPRD